MADWKQIARSFALADGRVDDKEVEIIRGALLADGRVDDEEMEFLLDLQRSVPQESGALDQLVRDCRKARGE